ERVLCRELRVGGARTPGSVLDRLRAGARGDIPETPKPGDQAFEHVSNLVVGNNALVADAGRVADEELGYRATVLTLALEGEARHVAGDLLVRARGLPSGSCLIAAGETTVT